MAASTPTKRPSDSLPITRFTSVVVRFRRLATTGLITAMVVHLIFLVLFWLLDIWLLMAFNIFSVLLYGLCLIGMRFPALRPMSLVLAWLEIIAHAGISTLALGAASGFHYLLLALVPLVYIDPRGDVLTRLTGLLILTGLFVGLDLISTLHDPWFLLREETLLWLRMGNGIICFIGLGTVINVYARSSRQSERDLRSMASTDLLTGLRNRRSLTDEALLLVAERRSVNHHLAVVLVDLDHFKQLNDRYGHAFGDQVLADTARLMNRTMRPGDSLARWGGEEFLILLTDADLDRAICVAERVRESIAAQTFRSDEGESLSITATLGVTEWRGNEEFEVCVSRADDALYLGKQNGRDRVEVAKPR
ncbi:GGDEF domain-containing protein [Marinobacter lacisalsi]|uniref:diguanylate cyclase n=1 Tax=Marinobacter lacisalsi TaxID=475979 RepID=A0ABV8QCD5_9GAMM